jgi:hypothetical protein
MSVHSKHDPLSTAPLYPHQSHPHINAHSTISSLILKLIETFSTGINS